MRRSWCALGSAVASVLSAWAAGEYPQAPGPESWSFRTELAKPSDAVHVTAVQTNTPWLKHRISRCYFAPIKRPPFNRDELADDIDYYPEPYLRRLQSERINGLWVTVEFEDLLAHPERLAKLRRVTERCERFGIRIWIFAMEPKAVRIDGERYRKSPDLFPCRHPWDGTCRPWCASDTRTLDYLRESVRDIFRAAPKLGGMLSITYGERCCSCFSCLDAIEGKTELACPVCARKQPWELHYALTEACVRGMREVNPEAEFLSWFYMPLPDERRAAWVSEAAKHLPPGVTLFINFESGIVCEQLGKPRIGGDYWLSAVGPSKPFVEITSAARAAGMPFGAKIQVGCSHEDATLPFVPVPGLLYRKYKAMKELGCSSVLQCWYFGNYPGVMNKAAGELAYYDFAEDEPTFLRRLAAEDWGADADEVARIWETLSDAYSGYPLSNTVQYFGPYHAGIVWPLEADLELRPLTSTWVCEKNPSGDAIGECLEQHTLDEVRELAARMVRRCEGLAGRLDALARKHAGNRERVLDVGVMRALVLQFASAFDIFDFYAARRDAVEASRVRHDAAAAVAALGCMRMAVRREQETTRAMLPLSRADSRLGFHSEAEAHQFFPARLEWRLRTLDETLQRLGEIEKAVAGGNPYPLSSWEKTAPTFRMDGKWMSGDDLRFRLTPLDAERARMEVETFGAKEVKVCVYDVSGVRFPGERIIRLRDGRGEIVLPLSEGSRLIVVRDDYIEAWPRRGDELSYRLNIGHGTGLRCGRCVAASGAKTGQTAARGGVQ